MLIVAEVTDPLHAEGLCSALQGWPGEVLLADATPLGLGRIGRELTERARPASVRIHRRNPPMLLGLAGAWNLGLRSTGIGGRVVVTHEHARPPGRRLGRMLDRRSDVPVLQLGGWGLTALTREAIGLVGLFDENLWPLAGITEDWSHRAELVGVEVESIGAPEWSPPALDPRADAYYRAKWGGPPGREEAALPFGDRPLPWWPRGATWRTWIDATGRDLRALTEGVDAPTLLRGHS